MVISEKDKLTLSGIRDEVFRTSHNFVYLAYDDARWLVDSLEAAWAELAHLASWEDVPSPHG